VAIEGEILGVGHGKTGALGGRQEDGKGRRRRKRGGGFLAGYNFGEREEFRQRSSELGG